MVLIQWDREKPDVTLISPDNKSYDVFTDGDDVLTVDDKVASYIIRNAKSGQWQVNYDKKSNSSLNVAYSEYLEGNWQESFDSVDSDNSYSSANSVDSSSSDEPAQTDETSSGLNSKLPIISIVIILLILVVILIVYKIKTK